LSKVPKVLQLRHLSSSRHQSVNKRCAFVDESDSQDAINDVLRPGDGIVEDVFLVCYAIEYRHRVGCQNLNEDDQNNKIRDSGTAC
jgi:hypothetical protein